MVRNRPRQSSKVSQGDPVFYTDKNGHTWPAIVTGPHQREKDDKTDRNRHSLFVMVTGGSVSLVGVPMDTENGPDSWSPDAPETTAEAEEGDRTAEDFRGDTPAGRTVPAASGRGAAPLA